MSARATHTVLSPYNIHVPFFPAPPQNLKKQLRAGGLVSFAQGEKCIDDYNRWATRWNENERAGQGHDPAGQPGHIIWDMAHRTRWVWHPTDGPWLRVSHKYPRQGHHVWEYPLTLIARLKDWDNCFYPRPQLSVEQIVWATWGNFWHDGRVPS